MLVCNYLIVSVFSLLLPYITNGSEYKACLVALGLTISVAGWLADARIGRYKMIHCSVSIMWTFMVLATVYKFSYSTVGRQLLPHQYKG